MPPETFGEALAAEVPDSNVAGKIMQFMAATTLEEAAETAGASPEVDGSVQELARLMDLLGQMGVARFCDFCPGIVRGLAYYTGVVFEVHECAQELRAICGGGRYDNLLGDFGGPSIPATGMGMGDCVLGILLEEKGLLQRQLALRKLDFFVACVDEMYRNDAVKLTMKLRSAGRIANFSYKATKLGKQLKQASGQNAEKCIIIGEEFKDNKLAIKDMATGEQELVGLNEFLTRLDCD